jgi:hypothetical protein
MAIEYDLTLEGKELTEEILLEEMEKLGLEAGEPERYKSSINISRFMDTLGFIVYLAPNDSLPPHDATDFECLEKEFKYGKRLSFRWDKFFERREIQYEYMFAIIFAVMNRVKANAVFAFTMGEEYCVFTKNRELYINNQSGIDKNPYFMRHTGGWKLRDMGDGKIEL